VQTPCSKLFLQNVGDYQLQRYTAYGDGSDYSIIDSAVSDSTDSSFSCQQITKWVEDCISNHARCNWAHSESWKPTRLLDLGQGTERLEPRLVISKDHFAGVSSSGGHGSSKLFNRYMTLSHCWGSIEILTLQNSNLETLRESIPLVRLPKTFRHAMKVTKSLGVRYLWIDSLCIIQDSETDWLLEAGSMYHVYQNSYCNIAATGAANGDQGCFFSRNPNTISATQVRPAWEDVTSDTYVVVQPLGHCRSRFLDSPLLRRAWVLQERLLARRSLHFTREQIFWECRTLMACELYPGGIRTVPECGGHHTQIGGDDLYIHRAPDSQEETNRGLSKEAIAWNRIVDLYTRCDLTKASDKLIALSGIAIEFHRTRLSPDDQYLAGLWKSQLPNALLWKGGGQSWEGAATTR
jgi:Heterokaryon incompatibility protein (HET)